MKLRLRYLSLALAGFALAGSAQANWIYLPSQNIPIPTDFAGVSIDVETGANAVGDLAGADINIFFGGIGVTNDADSTAGAATLEFVRLGTSTLDTAANLALGATVDGTSTFASGYGGSFDHVGPEFTDGVPGYLGFALDNGTSTLFGWMQVTFTANTPGGLVNEWAYDTNGLPILVGAPEASEALVIMCGLTGLLFGGRRRQRETA